MRKSKGRPRERLVASVDLHGGLAERMDLRGGGRSRIAKRDLDRYYGLMDDLWERMAPRFTSAERDTMAKALFVPWRNGELGVRYFSAVAPKVLSDGHADLAERVRRLDVMESAALLDHLEQRWAKAVKAA